MNDSEIRSKVMSGFVWTIGERALAQGISFVLTIILARILMPSEYGAIPMVMVFINIANVFVTNGLGESLIQKQKPNRTDFSTILHCSFALSVILYGLLFFAAPYIAEFYNKPQLTSILRVLALKIPISSVSTVQHAYVSKHMIFKKLFYSTLAGTIVSGVIGIAMALNGFGAWALVAQYLVNSILDAVVLFLIVPWRPDFHFSMSAAKQLVGYGWKSTAANLLNTLYSELRSLLIGRVYTADDLAYYNKGNQIPSLFIAVIDTATGQVVFPTMANSGGDTCKIKTIGRRAMKTTSYFIFPIMVGLALIAKPLIVLLLTEKWLPAVPYLQLSCFYWACQPIQTTNWQIIKATGRSDLCFKLEIVKKAVGVSMLFLAMNISVLAVAASASIYGFLSMLINMLPNKTLIGYSIKEQLADLLPPLLVSLVMGASIAMLSLLNIPDTFLLLLQITLGTAIYIGLSQLLKLDSLPYVVHTVKMMFKRKERSAASPPTSASTPSLP